MGNKKTIVLGLDYSEISVGISDVNRKMSLLDAEFKLAAEMAKHYGDETDLLTAKQDQLAQKIELQKKKVEAAKQAYDAAMSSQDKQEKKIDALDKALLKERTTLEKLNNELVVNKEKLDNLAISEVDRKMEQLEAEFKLASEQARLLGNESEQLTLKQTLLTSKIELQTQKVQASKKAYDDAVQSEEKSEKQLQELYKVYLENETALAQLNNELKEHTEKVNNSEEKTRSFGDSIRSVASSLGIEVNPAIETLASKFDGVSEKAGIAVLTLGTLATTLGSFTLSTAKTAGEVEELAHKTGMTTDTIQELNYAAEFLEISAEDIGSSMAKMTKNMNSARNGTGDAAEAFNKLHVRITEANGQLRDSEEVFYDTIDALGKVKNETEKDALSMAIFGKSAMQLNNLILEGSKGIKAYAKEAHDVGYVMDNETIQAFNNMDDSMVKLNRKFEAVKMKLGEALLPVFQAFADILQGIPTPVLVGIAVFGTLAIIIGTVASAANKLSVANALLSTTNTTVATTGIAATAGMSHLLLILLAVAAAIALIVGVTSGIKGAMSEVKDSVTDLVDSSDKVINSATDTTKSIGVIRKKSETYGNYYYAPDYSYSTGGRNYASGTEYFPGGETWIGDGGKPELIRLPRGSKIYNGNETDQLLGGDTYNINLNIKASDIDDIQKIYNLLNSIKQKSRQGVLQHG